MATPKRRKQYHSTLEEIRRGGTLHEAATAANTTLSEMCQWRKDDKNYDREVRKALGERRAAEGAAAVMGRGASHPPIWEPTEDTTAE